MDKLEQMSYENSLRRCCLGQFASCLFDVLIVLVGLGIVVWVLMQP